MASNLHEFLLLAAERYPDRVAVIEPKSSLNYSELYRRSLALAQELLAAGVRPGDRVGLSIAKSADAIAAAYGIMMAGACYVPIDPFVPSERATRIAKNVDMHAIVTTVSQLSTLVGDIAASCGSMTAFTPTDPPDEESAGFVARHWHADKEQDLPLPAVEGNHLAYILHTSGSTGLPKGVAITHRNALAFVDMAAEFFEVTPDDRLSSQAPLHFDLSVFDLYVASRQGASVVLIPEFYSAFPKKMLEVIEGQKITIWNSVPSTLTLMMVRGEPEGRSLDAMRLIFFAGETMPIKYLRLLRAYFKHAELVNGYGQTEANTSTYFRIDAIPDTDDWRIPIGQAFPGFDVFAVADDGRVIDQAGQEGELFVRADTVAQGYWNNREASSQRFVPDSRSPHDGVLVYRTGDRVRIDDNGDFVFVGRNDDMIKSRGYRIELGDIDQVLLSCAGVEAGAAIAIPDPVVGNRIAAFVSPATDIELSQDAILAHCKNRLPVYMVPEFVTIQSDLPRTSTGKIDRRSLVALAV
jgi:amino acid adenylation domain-containing protein